MQMTEMINLPGADLNAACGGSKGVRPIDGPNNARGPHRCNVKYEGEI